MAATLVWVVKEYERTGDWVYVQQNAPRYVIRSNEIGKLVHWKLVVQKPNEDPTKRCSGLWRPTKKGRSFVYQKISVPSHVYLYNNQLEGFTDKLVDVVGALGKRFNYAELMSEEIP
jgi:hypothetical protein